VNFEFNEVEAFACFAFPHSTAPQNPQNSAVLVTGW
jgi:hypothetical protein